jgi:photosystem II stability/assembly factor-like uncharacterized protein
MNAPNGDYRWVPTNAPVVSGRTDDIWFVDAQRGWAVNSNGHILYTGDGGASWQRQFSAGGVYLRCVAFANDKVGWVGTLAEERRILHTTDGGATWAGVEGLPAGPPPAVCGLSVVDEKVIYAAGSNFPERPTGVLKTADGGATWTATAMDEHATLLVDVHFLDADHGFVVGGKADGADPQREDCVPVVLATEDGGKTWENRLAPLKLAKGEWGWKIQFLDDKVGFVSMENFGDAAVLKTVDGGATWERKPINDPQDNANIEGIGFLDDKVGWAGGWGDENFESGFTSETRDGGENWTDANHVGKFLNRFRFIHEPELVGYASGDTVYKYTNAPPPAAEPSLAGDAERAGVLRTRLPLSVPAPARPEPVRLDVWDRFGGHVATVSGDEPTWSGETERGDTASPGMYIVRVSAGDWSESRAVVIEG